MPFKDNEKRKLYNKQYSKRHYLNSRAKYIEKAKNNNAIYIKRNKEFIRRVKLLKGCNTCEFKIYEGALEFHHIDSTNKVKVSTLVNSSVSLKKIKEEIRKCIILCSNCHKIEHLRIRSS